MKYTKRSKPCDACGGTGKLFDATQTGAHFRREREAAGVGVRRLARELGVSASYVSDLELGRRAWSLERIESYVAAIERLKGKGKR